MLTQVLLSAMLAASSSLQPLPAAAAAATEPAGTKEMLVDSKNHAAAAPAGEGVANLPFSHGKSFRTLDEYLDHLERYAGPIDQPWWREIRPGVYEHVKRMPEAKPEIATRAELMKRFGFTS